ncbi:hypothetical protein NDU88_000225 [Pleurodeles waltl]|uniref:Uncharacterized protein n=1 Tax=Pleurodeles waltl TaxID=8319 RepID=A0AAV7MLE5_PLEWA|nr:hypothetical protein NDU88_000225 [Pleurodeles waltl]
MLHAPSITHGGQASAGISAPRSSVANHEESNAASDKHKRSGGGHRHLTPAWKVAPEPPDTSPLQSAKPPRPTQTFLQNLQVSRRRPVHTDKKKDPTEAWNVKKNVSNFSLSGRTLLKEVPSTALFRSSFLNVCYGKKLRKVKYFAALMRSLEFSQLRGSG